MAKPDSACRQCTTATIDVASGRNRASVMLIGTLLCLLIVSCDSTVERASPAATFVLSVHEEIILLDRSGVLLYTYPWPGISPSWTDAGDAFLFGTLQSINMASTASAWSVELAEADPYVDHPYLLPDGGIVHQSGGIGTVPVYSVRFLNPADGTAIGVSGAPSSWSPAPAPGSGRVYFISLRDTTQDRPLIYEVGLDGLGLRSLPTTGTPGSIAVSDSEDLLAYSSNGRSVLVLDLNTEQLVDSLRLPDRHAVRGSIAFSPDADSLAIAAFETPEGAQPERYHLLVWDRWSGALSGIYSADHEIRADWRPR